MVSGWLNVLACKYLSTATRAAEAEAEASLPQALPAMDATQHGAGAGAGCQWWQVKLDHGWHDFEPALSARLAGLWSASAALETGGKGEDTEKPKHREAIHGTEYEFDVVFLTQRNLESDTVRRIRPLFLVDAQAAGSTGEQSHTPAPPQRWPARDVWWRWRWWWWWWWRPVAVQIRA